MRVSVNDEAARLRRGHDPIQCGEGMERKSSDEFAGPLSHSRNVPDGRDCADCGQGDLSCRCNPGEG